MLGGGAVGGGHELCGVVVRLPTQQQDATRVGVPGRVPPPGGEGVGDGPGARGELDTAVLRVVPAAVHQPGLAVPVGALALVELEMWGQCPFSTVS